MAEKKNVDLFCEDLGHELFVRALMSKLGQEIGVSTTISSQSVRGGHGLAISEFVQWQRAVRNGMLGGCGDLLVVVIDGNSEGWRVTRSAIEAKVDKGLFPYRAIGCPDPHVEAWCFADPQGFRRVVGKSPSAPAKIGKLPDYKGHLCSILDAQGLPVLTDTMEYSDAFVEQMDFYKAGKKQPSLGSFIEQLRACLTSLATGSKNK